ncbi:MAG: GNAT family N-acetyltransferase [archaeon]|jgi:GNAT superfamily N-acetyltransferase
MNTPPEQGKTLKLKKIPVKILEATHLDIDEMYRELSSFSILHPRKFHFMSIEKVFVAKTEGKIVGFVTILPEGYGKYEINGLYTRLGFDRRGIGSKLFGTANSYLFGVGARHVTLTPASGRRLVGPDMIEEWAGEFYRKTNYSYNTRDYPSPKFEWFPTPNRRKRKPKQKVSRGLAPQNLMNPLKLRRRR